MTKHDDARQLNVRIDHQTMEAFEQVFRARADRATVTLTRVDLMRALIWEESARLGLGAGPQG